MRAFLSEVSGDLKTPKFRKYDKEILDLKSVMENMNERAENIDELFIPSRKLLKES